MAVATLRRNAKPKKPNRRERRQKPVGLPWVGRCHCDACKGRPWPAVYMVAVDILDADVRWRVVREPRRVLDRVEIGYECFEESIAPTDRVSFLGLGPSTTSSASAASIQWVATHHESGVDIDLGECELPPEDDRALNSEVDRLNSLRSYLARIGVRDRQEENQRIQRYYDLCEMHRGNDRRTYQWLHNEFPGWLK